MRRGDGIVLVSCYELGRVPLGVASPAAFLRRVGFDPCALDLSVQPLDALPDDTWREAWLVAVSVPMHTALRVAIEALPEIRRRAPRAVLVFHGLYAALNHHTVMAAGVDATIGGESEEPLTRLAQALHSDEPLDRLAGIATDGAADRTRVDRLDYLPPDRSGLPPAERYAALAIEGELRPAVAIETTRGCKHHCRHCPIPPLYDGRFVAVPREVVLEDIDRVVETGVRHITFADPDFLNGPSHAVRIARELHARHPEITFDFTAKVEHLVVHEALLPELGELGAVFAVTAVESLNDEVLEHLDKQHTGENARAAVASLRTAGIAPRPSLVPFTPWETLDSFGEILHWIAREDLIENVDPVQLSIRLLVPPGSSLESHPSMTPHLHGIDSTGLQHRWMHPDPRMDTLQRVVERIAREAATTDGGAHTAFVRIRDAWASARGVHDRSTLVPIPPRLDRAPPPRLTEPWFC